MFDSNLWKVLEACANVVIVWTGGAFDRMLGVTAGAKELETDFLYKEWTLALKLKKHIVPVAHETFAFPDRNRLPEDVRPILDHNAIPWVGAYRRASTEKLLGELRGVGGAQ